MYKVLLVDDDNIARCVCANMPSWQKYGFEVAYEASNGRSAFEILESKQVDVVFTDIRMPGMDGLALLKKIRSENMNVFVVLVSLYREFEYAREGLKYGAVDYIMKPIQESSLDETLLLVRTALNEFAEVCEYRALVDACFADIDADMNDVFISNLRDQIADRLGTTPSMDDIAESLGFSKDYFGKIVKQKTGMSFNKLFTSIKMQYSKRLLLSGRYKVYEISDMIGYANPDYFTRVFKNEFGMSPADLKRTSE